METYGSLSRITTVPNQRMQRKVMNESTEEERVEREVEEECPKTKRKHRNSNSPFTKPDIYCRFSACLHLLGAISIMIGCLLIKSYTLFGIIFLGIGVSMTIIGILLTLLAVSMILKQNRRGRKKFGWAPNDKRLGLVSNYFAPSAQTRSVSLPLKTQFSIENSTISPSMETITTEKSANYLEPNHEILTKPELIIQPPSNESTPKRCIDGSSPSRGWIDPLINAHIIPFNAVQCYENRLRHDQ